MTRHDGWDWSIDEDLALAHRLADVAATTALQYFGPSVATEAKADGSPVTEADLDIDRQIVETLRHERPEDAILSEESGPFGEGARRWIIDPLDATSFFARGDRGWGTYVALERERDNWCWASSTTPPTPGGTGVSPAAALFGPLPRQASSPAARKPSPSLT